MPEETLALRMKAYGSRGTARDVNRVGRSLLGVAASEKAAKKEANLFSRALTFLGTRMGMIIILGTVLTATLGPPLLTAIVLLTAAIVALGGVLVGVFLLGAGVVMRFKQQADKAGTAAYKLKNQFLGMKKAFGRAIAPGADAVMVGLTRAMETLEPVLASMRPVFTMFGKAMGRALQVAAEGLAELGPEFRTMLTNAAPMLIKLATLFAPLLGAFIDIANYGMPVLSQLLDWLIDFAFWLRPALSDLNAFAHSAQAAEIVGTVFDYVGVAAQWVADVFSALWPIAKELWTNLAPTVIPALLGALDILRDVLMWVGDNIEWLMPIFLGLLAAFIWFVAPIGGVVGSILILIGVLVYLYNKFEAVRWIVQAVIDWVKILWWLFWHSPVGVLLKLIGTLVGKLWDAAGGWDGIKAAFTTAYDWMVEKIQYVIDKVQALWDKLTQVAQKISGLQVAKVGGQDKGLLGFGGIHKFDPLFKAEGGPAAGPTVVGERGPELLDLPRGSYVHPNASGGDTWIAATFITPDGDVLAKQTVRAAKRKQSTR